MRESKFSEAQVVGIPREGDAEVPVAVIKLKHGISRPTNYLWKSKYGGASVPELQRLAALELENVRLKRMYTDLALEFAAVKDGLISLSGAKSEVSGGTGHVLLQPRSGTVVDAPHHRPHRRRLSTCNRMRRNDLRTVHEFCK